MTLFGLSDIAGQSLTLLNWAMQTGAMISLLIVIILIIRRPFAKTFGARAAYALWVLPALRLMMPTIALPAAWLPFLPTFKDGMPRPATMTYELTEHVSARIVSDFDVVASSAMNGTAIVVGIWLLGIAVWLARQFYLYRVARGDIMIHSDAANPSLRQSAQLLCKQIGLRRIPDIRMSRRHVGPFVMGLFRPLIILPQNFANDFNATQQRYALMHELAHVKRFDLWAAAAALLFRAANWPNPLVHCAAAKFRADQEAACDASVLDITDDINARHDYGQTLVHAAKFKPHMGRIYTDVPIGLTLNHPLKERIMTLKNPLKQTNWLTRSAAMTAIVVGCALTAPFTVAAGHPDNDLAGAYNETKSKSARKSKSRTVIDLNGDDDGRVWKKKYEIFSDGNGIVAWETDKLSGVRRMMDLHEIEGFDMDAFKRGSWSFSADDGGALKFLKDSEANKHHSESITRHTIQGYRGELPVPPKVPDFPKNLHFHNDKGVTIFRYNDADGQHSNPLNFNLDADMSVFLSEQTALPEINMRLQVTRSKLEAARAILGDQDMRELTPDVRRSLEKARQALADAEKALAKSAEN